MSLNFDQLMKLSSGVSTPTTPSVNPDTTPIKTSYNKNTLPSPDLGHGKFFTGSGLQKAMDVLSIPQYASAGIANSLVTGKNPIKGIGEGIQNRQSYSDVLGNAGVTNKYAKAIGGFAGDVLLDPTTYIGGGLVKAGLKKIPVLAKGITAAEEAVKTENLVKNVPGFQKVGGLISNKIRTAGNIDYLNSLEKLRQGAGEAVETGADIAQKLIKSPIDFNYGKYSIKSGDVIPDVIQKRISQVIQGGITGSKDVGTIATPVIEKFKELANKQVELGLADKGVFKNLYGKYLPSYLKKKSGEGFGLGGNKINVSRFKTRQVPTNWSGFIDSPAYRAGRGIAEEQKNVATGEFFDTVAKNWVKTPEEIALNGSKGFTKLPESKSLGKLSGQFVPDYVHQDIVGLNKMPGQVRSELTKNYDKILSVWKAGKTVLNPSQQIRNTLSNQIQNYMVGGAGVSKTLPKAIKGVLSKDAAYQEAKKAGTFANGFSMNEINKLLPSQSSDGVLKKSLEKIKSGWNKAIDVGGKMQNTNEEIAKLQQFIFQRSKGKTPEEAKSLAEKALFNYGDLTPFEKNVLKRIVPFYTFSRKAIPLVAETAIKHPNRLTVFNKAQNAINNLTPERANEQKLVPSYLKNAVRVPGTKNKYLGTDYLYPWGGILGESSLPFGMNIPAYDIASKVISGYDPYYKQPLTNSPLPEDMKKAKVKAVAQTLMPSLPQKVLLPSSNKSPGLQALGALGFNVYNLDTSKATAQQQYQIKDLQSKTSSEMKKAAIIPDAKTRTNRMKRLQQNFQDQVKTIMGN